MRLRAQQDILSPTPQQHPVDDSKDQLTGRGRFCLCLWIACVYGHPRRTTSWDVLHNDIVPTEIAVADGEPVGNAARVMRLYADVGLTCVCMHLFAGRRANWTHRCVTIRAPAF
jgi:hypothetical protein